MIKFVIKAILYVLCFLISMYGLSALDFNRFIKKGKVSQGQLLFFILACALAYLLGSFLINIIYYFNM